MHLLITICTYYIFRDIHFNKQLPATVCYNPGCRDCRESSPIICQYKKKTISN